MSAVLKNVCLLANDHGVCNAYLTRFLADNVIPNRIVYFRRRTSRNVARRIYSIVRAFRRRLLKRGGTRQVGNKLDEQAFLGTIKTYCQGNSLAFPKFEKSVSELIKESGISVETVEATGINDAEVAAAIAAGDERFVVFSGGGILRRRMLSLPKRFIHVHPGVVPSVKGADGILWSSLVHRTVGMSAFFMNSGIDTGDVLQTREYEVPKILSELDAKQASQHATKLIVDYVDPVFRADLLGDLFREQPDPALWTSMNQDPNAGKTYYFMHSEIKKLAVRRWVVH